MTDSMDRPNYGSSVNIYEYTYLGDNNLRREFYDCFSVILSSCYQDTTKWSRYLDKADENGRSAYYVSQPKIEQKLKDFLESPVDDDKFLIGFTGIGKTSLLRNFFGLSDSRPLIIGDGQLMAYLSVYSDILKSEKELERMFCTFLMTIVQELQKQISFDVTNDSDIKALFQYIELVKKRYVSGDSFFENSTLTIGEQLRNFEMQHPIDFLAILIAYHLEQINHQAGKITKLILVFDDIESIDVSLHIPFINLAQKISAKLKEAVSRSFVVKSIISLRNYTFRYNYARLADAMRNYTEEDVILKDSIPQIKDIFIKRFNVYYDNPDIRSTIREDRWNDSVKVLRSVVDNLSNFGESVAALANYDISHSLKLFLRILTNRRWFAPTEEYYYGAYSLDEKDYPPVKERTMKALLYGETDVFVDSFDSVLPNILRYHIDEKEDVELLALYMEFMLTLQRSKEVTLYGRNKISGKELKERIIGILKCDRTERIDYVIGQLYRQRCLLRSIFEPETSTPTERHTGDRNYHDSFGLYLSIRGKRIMEILSNDSLLLEIFRDDIDTVIESNTIPSSGMGQTDKLLYLISYCGHLFELEKAYIQYADKQRYFKSFGYGFVVTRLIRGIHNSFTYYYKRIDDDYQKVKTALNSLLINLNEYKKLLIDTDPSLMFRASYPPI